MLRNVDITEDEERNIQVPQGPTERFWDHVQVPESFLGTVKPDRSIQGTMGMLLMQGGN